MGHCPPQAGGSKVSRLDQLWAGWRSAYISSVDAEPESSGFSEASSSTGEATGSTGEAGREPASRIDTPGSADGASERERCVFCGILSSGVDDSETHVVRRDPGGLVVALLNAYPYGTGHLMVMPVRHTGDLETLMPAESSALWATVADAVRAVKRAYRPDGLNVGANLGRAAGAGVPGHLHIHVLPRWAGDTNFMTSIAETRVLPEALSVTADKLRGTWPA